MVEFSLRHPKAFESDREKVDIIFTIQYKTEFGQTLAIVGDNKRVGNWSDLSVGSMKWHTGNLWKVTLKDLFVDEPFQYKYVVIDSKTKVAIRWEDGRNRICDPAYLSAPEGSESAST